MLKRRTTLKLGLSGFFGGALPLGALSSSAAAHSQVPTKLHVIYDSTISESRLFAGSFAGQYPQIHDTASSGIAELWYRQLRPALRDEPATLFGLTGRFDMFCLEELARDLNMKVRFRIDHLADSAGTRHQSSGPEIPSALCDQLSKTPGFGRQIAHLTDLATQNLNFNKDNQKTGGPYTAPGQTALVSWMLSPKNQ